MAGAGSVASLCGQSPSSAEPKFAAASIKLNTAVPGGRKGPPGGVLNYKPGRIVGSSVSAWRMILEAFRLSQYQLSGGPNWLESERYTVEAKAEGPADEAQLRLMLQSLLRERFKLVVHRDTRQMPVYALTVSKTGSKLLESNNGESMPSARELASRGYVAPQMERIAGILADRGAIDHLADMLNLTGKLDRPVVDRTNLHGTYLFIFRWDAEENFMAELEEQSGLKFVSQREPVPILVVDRIERPDAN